MQSQNRPDCDTGRAPVASHSAPTDDQLARELHRLGVRHLSWPRDTVPGRVTPMALLVGLAGSTDARLRGALVPLFLLRPDMAGHVPVAADALVGPARAHLVCAYSAAAVLQGEYGPGLTRGGLPELFADELDLPVAAGPERRLAAIAERHAKLVGEEINWSGTYRHAADACLRRVEAEST